MIKNSNPRASGENDGVKPVPIGYRIMIWILLADIFLIIGRSWVIAWNFGVRLNAGEWLPGNEFGRIFFALHLTILFIASIGFLMKAAWRKYGTLELFPVVMLIATLFLNILAVELTMVVPSVAGK